MLLRLQEMALVRGRFHGDLHAGNVLVGVDGRQAWLDWGIVGELDASQARGAGQVFAGVLLGDFALAVDGLECFGVAPDDRAALIDQLDHALSPLVGDGLRGADLSTLLRRTLRIALARRVAIPQGMWLMAKQIAYFDAYARALVPERRLLEDATEIYAYFVSTHPEVTDDLAGGRVDEVLSRLA
jgi:predicted unusual protein kinase regulating ubiquinone biosynthesis (AarF/ABC1/UbiB family)